MTPFVKNVFKTLLVILAFCVIGCSGSSGDNPDDQINSPTWDHLVWDQGTWE